MLVADAKFQTEFRDVQTVLVDDDVGPYQVVGVGLKAGRSSNMKKNNKKKLYIFNKIETIQSDGEAKEREQLDRFLFGAQIRDPNYAASTASIRWENRYTGFYRTQFENN